MALQNINSQMKFCVILLKIRPHLFHWWYLVNNLTHQQLIVYLEIELQQNSRKAIIQKIQGPLGFIEKRKTRAATFHIDLVHASQKKGSERGEMILDVLVVMVTATICIQANKVKYIWWFIGAYACPHHTKKFVIVLYTSWLVKCGIVERHIDTAYYILTADVKRILLITCNVHTMGYWRN